MFLLQFSENLKLLRERHNLSKIQLAKIIGMTDRALYNYEANVRIPKLDVVTKMAKVFGVTVDELVSNQEQISSTHAARETFLQTAKKPYGSRDKKEAEALLVRASALFSGGDLDEESKDKFFRALTNAFLTAKKEARNTYEVKQKK